MGIIMKRLVLLLLVAAQLPAMELISTHGVSAKDEALKLYHNNHDMYVEDENAAYRIEKHQMNKELRDLLKYKVLAKFIESEGIIRINKEDDDSYSLVAKTPGLGGGPVSAWWAYTLTKGTIYGSVGIAAGAAVSTAVVASGGGVLAAAAGGSTAKAISTAVSAASGLGGAASIGTAGVASGITSAVGVSTVATAATSLTVSSGESALGIMAAVEGASLFVGALFAGPWCP